MADVELFTRTDADRILERAAQIDGSHEDRALSLDDLRAIAAEAGFGSRAVDRAIAEARPAGPSRVSQPAVHRSGLVVTYLSTARSLQVELDSDQLLRAVRLFHPYREGPATVNLEENEITWRDRKGLRFTVVSGRGSTQIRVFVSKVLIRRGRWTGWVKTAADRLEGLVRLVHAQPGAPLDETRGSP